MKAVTGVFQTRTAAENAAARIRTLGVPEDKVSLLTPGDITRELQSVPVTSAEQPGMGKAVGALLGAATGMSAGGALVAAAIPGVGPTTAIGLLGAAVLAAAGAGVGVAAGGKIENFTTEGLPEDEIFVYEDALRKGRSVLVVLAESEKEAQGLRELLEVEGAESIDAAREQWWIGLRSAEQEHYEKSSRNFTEDEKFYRLGFEAALHARSRCRDFQQVSREMARGIEDLQRQYPSAQVAEPFTRGYRRGREYYTQICKGAKAA